MPSVGLRRLKHEIAQHTNNGMTFEEIYEFEVDGKRIVAFQIPAGSFATPTTWHGIPWSRENESLVEMPKFKLDAIYGQSRPDWSRQIAYEANLDDLDPEAVSFACAKFVEKFGGSQPAVRNLDERSILSKMALVIHGHVSNAALVLLGKPESSVFLGGIESRITWTLYASDGSTMAYEHFEPPFILQVDRVLGKIRNEKYRFFDREETLFPTETRRYSPEVIRELLRNAIGIRNVFDIQRNPLLLSDAYPSEALSRVLLPSALDARRPPVYPARRSRRPRRLRLEPQFCKHLGRV